MEFVKRGVERLKEAHQIGKEGVEPYKRALQQSLRYGQASPEERMLATSFLFYNIAAEYSFGFLDGLLGLVTPKGTPYLRISPKSWSEVFDENRALQFPLKGEKSTPSEMPKNVKYFRISPESWSEIFDEHTAPQLVSGSENPVSGTIRFDPKTGTLKYISGQK